MYIYIYINSRQTPILFKQRPKPWLRTGSTGFLIAIPIMDCNDPLSIG